MKPISIPVISDHNWWEGTSGIQCECGGTIVWAEAGYVPGSRACRSCLTLFAVRGDGENRRLHPQGITDNGVIGDVGTNDPVHHVPENLYPGFKE